MSRTPWLLSVAFVALVGPARAADPLPPTANLTPIFQQEHDRQVRAFNHKDLTGFLQHYTRDAHIELQPGKPMDLAGWRSFIAGILPDITGVVVHRHTVDHVDLRNGAPIAHIVEQEKYRIQDREGQFGKKGARHVLAADSTYEETWVHTPAGWRVQRMKIVSETMHIDGKTVSPPG